MRAELKRRLALALAGAALALAARLWGVPWPGAGALGAAWVALAPAWVQRRAVQHLERRLGVLPRAAWESLGRPDPYGFHATNRARAALALPGAPLPLAPPSAWAGIALAGLLAAGALFRPAPAPGGAAVPTAPLPLARGLEPPGVRSFPLPRAQAGQAGEYAGPLEVTEGAGPLPGAASFAQNSVLERISQALALGAVTPGLPGEDLGQVPNGQGDLDRFGSDLEEFLNQVLPREDGDQGSPDSQGRRRSPLGRRSGQAAPGDGSQDGEDQGEEGAGQQDGSPQLEEGGEPGLGDSPGLGEHGLTERDSAGGIGSLGSDSLEVDSGAGADSDREEFLRGQMREGPSYAGAVRLPPRGEGLDRDQTQLPDAYARAIEGAAQDPGLPAEYREVLRQYFGGGLSAVP